jgi:hypothetical protein
MVDGTFVDVVVSRFPVSFFDVWRTAAKKGKFDAIASGVKHDFQ